MKFNLDGKIFQSIENTENGEVSSETLFHYHQDGEIVSADYSGGNIIKIKFIIVSSKTIHHE